MSMLLPPFELHEPKSVAEAVKLKHEFPASDFVAGGTDLLPNYKWGLNTRSHVISLARVAELRAITPESIGALATLAQIEHSGVLAQKLPALPQTAALIATPLLRASGTLGGNLMLENRCFFFNQTHLWRESKGYCMKADGDKCLVVPQKEICYATFSADLPATLIALGASIDLVSHDAARRVPLAEFYQPDGIRRHHKKSGELVTGVTIPKDAQQLRATYKKLRLRDSFDFPELGIAAAIKLEGERVTRFHLVANALETTPVILDDLGADIMGKPLTDDAITSIAKAAEARVRPVKNTFLPPSYRKAMTRVFTERALREVRGLG